MLRRLVLSVFLFAAVATAALYRVDLPPGVAVEALSGTSVLMEFNGWCLVSADAGVVGNLELAGFRVSVLDDDLEQGLYVYAMPRPGLDRGRLAAFGRILTEDATGVLLATSEDGIGELNRLPVEFCRVPREPMVLSGSDQRLPSVPAVDDSLVWMLVNRVGEDSVLSHIRRLKDFYTRYSTTDSCRRAVDWVRSKFVAYGCDSTALETYRSNYAPNVIGVKRGRVNARPIYIICGHADNTSDQPPDRCPGSDDNASGTSAAIEACRVFADVVFDNSVWFIGFTGEEQGLYGSDSFARRAYRRGDSIKAVLNFDMISYGRQDIDTFEVIGKISNPNCAWLVDYYIAQADTFTSLKTKRSMVSSAPYSDHHSFWQRGYVAFCGIENDFTPLYHTIGDTIGPLYYTWCGTNNVPMATEAIKAGVASIAKLAGAHPRTAIAESGKPARPARLLRVTPTLGRPPVTIEMTPAGSRDARIEVYDATGSAVRTLAAAPKVEWNGLNDDGRKAGAGVYLLRVTDDGLSSTAKAVLTE